MGKRVKIRRMHRRVGIEYRASYPINPVRRVVIPANPFIAAKRRLARDLVKIGFQPVSGSAKERWIWRGRLCRGDAIIVLPKIIDAENPIELWVDKNTFDKWNWYRKLEERKFFDGWRNRKYVKVCVFYSDIEIQGLIIEFLQRLKMERGIECPELRSR